MSITYRERESVFKLDTPGTSYVLGIVDEEGFAGHIYYGKRLGEDDLTYLMRTEEAPFVPSENNRDRNSFLDSFPMEYPGSGSGDYREGAIGVSTKAGHRVVQPLYKKHKIYPGKPALDGLPATFGGEDTCDTLELALEDKILGLEIILYYTAFQDVDVITRSVQVKNLGAEEIYLTKVLSASFDMDNQNFDMISLHGSWARERRIQRRSLGLGKQSIGSVRGESSHQEHPFLAFLEKGADQKHGEVYAMNFVYSGNFLAQIEVNQFDSLRAMMGIHPENFCWKLEQKECFQAPEVVMVYSCEGLGKMTRTFHDLYRNHLIRGKYKDKKRPILINNWEATYFDFHTEKLLKIAREASGLGIEMLVMDDGWFGHREADNSSLGDWFVNEKKLNGGLKYLVDEVNKLGMKFGIWVEPEMISEDSKLYQAHPDWALQTKNRRPGQCREQLVLDLSRPEVADTVYGMLKEILSSAPIGYVKWDMNRPLADVGNAVLPPDRQGEILHRFVLAVYGMQERMLQDFPELLLENCSSGGARFDPGMLYYSPQIWCSDDTDAIERLSIQEGTQLIYPLSAIGAHVSDCPNHITGRVTPFETRGIVALTGTFGYELDITRIPQKDRDQIPEQISLYKQYNHLVRNGEYYRIASYQENHLYDCHMVVSQDKSEALVTYVQVMAQPHQRSRKICLQGLQEDAFYEAEGSVYQGSTLMYAGLLFPQMKGDFQAKLISLKKVLL